MRWANKRMEQKATTSNVQEGQKDLAIFGEIVYYETFMHQAVKPSISKKPCKLYENS